LYVLGLGQNSFVTSSFLFWDVMWFSLVVIYQLFRTTFREIITNLCHAASQKSQYLFRIKPTRCTNFTNLFWHETPHVSDSSSVHHQEFFHRTLSSGICHTGL